MRHPEDVAKKKRAITPVDPVCGKRIKRQRSHVTIEYGGATYYLCCPLCQAEFERNPRKYVLR